MTDWIQANKECSVRAIYSGLFTAFNESVDKYNSDSSTQCFFNKDSNSSFIAGSETLNMRIVIKIEMDAVHILVENFFQGRQRPAETINFRATPHLNEDLGCLVKLEGGGLTTNRTLNYDGVVRYFMEGIFFPGRGELKYKTPEGS